MWESRRFSDSPRDPDPEDNRCVYRIFSCSSVH